VIILQDITVSNTGRHFETEKKLVRVYGQVRLVVRLIEKVRLVVRIFGNVCSFYFESTNQQKTTISLTTSKHVFVAL
jgi:hypothetical protein